MALRNVNAVVTITTNAVKAIEDGKKLKEVYAAINQQLNLMRAEGKTDTTEFKEMQKLATDTKAKIDALVSGMKLIRGVIDNLANKQGRDLNRALRETSKEFNRTANDTDKHKAKLEQLRSSVAALKRELSDRKGLTMSFSDAQKQLQNLANTPLDKLRSGLASIRAELEGNINSKTRSKLQGWEKQYAAQIAIRETGTLPTSSLVGVQQSDRTRLEAERKRLVDAYNVASLSDNKQHVIWADQALQRIQALNAALKQLTEEEQKRDKAARDATAYEEKRRQAFDAFEKVVRNQKVSLKELTDAYVLLQDELKTLKGANLNAVDQSAVQGLENVIARIKGAMTDISQIDVQKTIDSLSDPNATTNLAQMEEALKKLKENASQIGMHDDAGFQKYTEDVEKLEAAIDQLKVKLQGLNDIDYSHLENYSTEKLQAELKNLEDQEKKLAGTQKAEAEVVARKKSLVQAQLLKNKLAVEDFANAEKVASEMGKHSVTELQQAYDILKLKLTNLATDQKREIARTKEQMAKLKGEIDKVTSSVKVQSTIWQTAVRNITAYVGVFGAFNFIKNKIAQVFESNKQLSDSLANIRKVSGLTSGEINELYTNIAKIDTRNSVEQLNNLAYAGAKLGIQEHGGVSALTGFVRAAEQVQMALGEDLGEEALPALAKLTEVMGLMDSYGVEEAMQKASSAIFMLSTTSTSTGNEIIEFSKRLMGLANVSHISASELLALGSASSSMGLMAEVSSTAFNKVFTKIQSNTEAIEKAVGVTKGSLKSLVDEGKTMEAIVTVFDKMRDMSMEEMQRRGIFTALGSDGARLNNVMTTMADRVDMLKKHLDTANQSFEEGEAVIAEYMIQNQTAAAYIERASNAFEKAFTNPEGVDLVTNLAKQWHEFAIEMTNSTLMMGSMKAALIAILAVVKGLIVVLPMLIQFLLFKGSLAAITQIVLGFSNMAKAIWAAVTATKALTAAQKWNGVTTALALVAATFMTIKSAMNEVSEEAERARQKQQELDKAFVSSKDVIDKSTQSLEEYKTALDKSNLSQDERDKRLRAYMKNEYQPYLDFLGIEIEKVEDLADAYAQVTFAIKQKAAAEEKENYRSRVNGENRNQRIAAQADVIREAQKAGYKIDKNFLESNWGESASTIYSRATGGNAYVEKKGLTLAKFPELLRAIRNYQKFKSEETRIDTQVERMFNEEYKDLGLENFSLEEFRNKQVQAQIEREKNRKTTVDMPPSKDELKAQKKAEQEEKAALRKDLKDAKEESDAIIAKVEEWYRLQEAVVTGFAADGKWTQEQAEAVNRELEMAKNQALANARLAISGRDTATWERTKEQMRVLMFDMGDWSQELFQQMMDVSMSSIRQNLANIDKGGGQYGITTSSLKDALDKNAAGNLRKVEEIRNKTAKEVEKALLKYNFFDQAVKAFEARLTDLGLLTETAEQAAYRLQQSMGSLKAPERTEEQMTQARTTARQQAGMQFVNGGGRNYGMDINSTANLQSWLTDFTGAQGTLGTNGFEYQFSGWADAFKDEFNKWLQNAEFYKAQIQSFYLSLVDFDTQYYKTVSDYKSKQDELFKGRWEASGKGRAYDTVNQEIDLQSRNQKMAGTDKGATFGQLAGFAQIGQDPEVQASLVRMAQMQEELELYKQVNEAKDMSDAEREAFMQGVHEREMALAESEKAMQESLMANINEQISKMEQWTEPIQQFSTDVGEALGEALVSGESFEEGMRNALKSLVQSWGQSTIQIVKELMMQQLKQKLIGKMMVKQEKQTQGDITQTDEESGKARLNATNIIETGMASVMQTMGNQMLTQKQAQDSAEMSAEGTKATGTVMAGIAEGAAKIIGTLGPWGAPLIAVITALLMGLLSVALGALGGGSKKETASTKSATKLKMVSGMLTYDEGNLNNYVGSDGHVYRAREQKSLPEGVSVIKEPIATTVNGQPSLVGEKGPEIVIGRKTSKRVMMNAPGILHSLMAIERGGRYSGRGYRLFDEGNLGDVMGDMETGRQGVQDERMTAALEQNTSMMQAMMQTIQQLQAKGIPATVAPFGKGSLDEGMRSVQNFRKRYPNG